MTAASIRTLQVKAKPGARVSAFTEQPDGSFLAQLKSPPVDGKANEELRVLVAEHLGVPRAQVIIKSGAGARLKLVQIHPA